MCKLEVITFIPILSPTFTTFTITITNTIIITITISILWDYNNNRGIHMLTVSKIFFIGSCFVDIHGIAYTRLH